MQHGNRKYTYRLGVWKAYDQGIRLPRAHCDDLCTALAFVVTQERVEFLLVSRPVVLSMSAKLLYACLIIAVQRERAVIEHVSDCNNTISFKMLEQTPFAIYHYDSSKMRTDRQALATISLPTHFFSSFSWHRSQGLQNWSYRLKTRQRADNTMLTSIIGYRGMILDTDLQTKVESVEVPNKEKRSDALIALSKRSTEH